jgi:hypothetical protein
MTTAPDFIVEASALGRIVVRWSEGDTAFHFRAKVDGDVLGELDSSVGRRHPTIYRHQKATANRRASTASMDADVPEFAGRLAHIRARIAAEHLASKCLALAAQERGEREAEHVRRKAARVREHLGVAGAVGLGEIPDDLLAEAFDRIQESVWWTDETV